MKQERRETYDFALAGEEDEVSSVSLVVHPDSSTTISPTDIPDGHDILGEVGFASAVWTEKAATPKNRPSRSCPAMARPVSFLTITQLLSAEAKGVQQQQSFWASPPWRGYVIASS